MNMNMNINASMNVSMNVNVNDMIVVPLPPLRRYCSGYRWCVNSVQISSFEGNMSAKLISEKRVRGSTKIAKGC